MSQSDAYPGRQNYLIKVALQRVEDPQIIRTLSCPAEATFHEFHQALQLAFGWVFCHQYSFGVLDHTIVEYPVQDCAARDFRAPARGHWRSDGDDRELQPQADAVEAEQEDPASSVFRQPALREETPGLRVRLRRRVGALDQSTGRRHPISCAWTGKGHPCAEDVGGSTGWKTLKEAYRATEPSAKQKELRSWYGEVLQQWFHGRAGRGRIWRWDRDLVNARLGDLPRLPEEHDRTLDA